MNKLLLPWISLTFSSHSISHGEGGYALFQRANKGRAISIKILGHPSPQNRLGTREVKWPRPSCGLPWLAAIAHNFFERKKVEPSPANSWWECYLKITELAQAEKQALRHAEIMPSPMDTSEPEKEEDKRQITSTKRRMRG